MRKEIFSCHNVTSVFCIVHLHLKRIWKWRGRFPDAISTLRVRIHEAAPFLFALFWNSFIKDGWELECKLDLGASSIAGRPLCTLVSSRW